MITPKAQELSRQVRDLFAANAPQLEQQRMSVKLFDEILSNCDPTAEEFSRITDAALISGRILYRLIFDGFQQRRWHRRLFWVFEGGGKG